MKIINWFIRLLSNTIGQWHLPFVDKKFNLADYFEIEKKIREFESPFVIGLVCTYGHGSNFLIKIGQGWGQEKRKKKVKVTHALAHIGIYNGFKHRAVEAIGEGLRETPLLNAIGARDVVILRKPNPKYLNSQVCKYTIEYLKELADKDAIENIGYDNDHDYSNSNSLDCSETIYQALSYAFKKAGHGNPIKMVNRSGKLTWTPADVRFSDLFIDFYVSGKGFTDGNLY